VGSPENVHNEASYWPRLTDSREYLKVHYLGDYVKERYVSTVLPWISAVDLRTHGRNLRTVLKGVVERVFMVGYKGSPARPYTPQYTHLCRWQKTIRKLHARTRVVRRYTPEQVCEAYDGPRRRVYEAALDSLHWCAVNIKDSYVKFFPKWEFFNFRLKGPEAPVRIISPRSPRFNVVLGTFIKPLEKACYAALRRLFGFKACFKGMNMDKRARQLRKYWEEFDDPIAIGLDANRFDQSVHYLTLKSIEHYYYLLVFMGDALLKELLSWQTLNKGFFYCLDGFIKYAVLGTRCSGDMNTSLGNCLLMCTAVYTYFDNWCRIKYRLANDGDDCVIIIERKNLNKLANMAQEFRGFGFSLKLEQPVEMFEKIVFCRSQPVFDGSRWTMIRDPKEAVNKDVSAVKYVSDETYFSKWCYSVGKCGESLAGNMPIYSQLYKKLQAVPVTRHVKLETGMEQLSRGMKNKFSEPTQDARLSFARAFDISPTKQIEIENVIAKLDAPKFTPERGAIHKIPLI